MAKKMYVELGFKDCIYVPNEITKVLFDKIQQAEINTCFHIVKNAKDTGGYKIIGNFYYVWSSSVPIIDSRVMLARKIAFKTEKECLQYEFMSL